MVRPVKEFALAITIDAPLTRVWAEMVDWEGQSEWMFSTRVYDDPHSVEGVGHTLRAFTGPFARWNRILGIMDEMVVSEWEPPRFCRVEHVGRIIRGYGTFRSISNSIRLVRGDQSTKFHPRVDQARDLDRGVDLTTKIQASGGR
jgi:hypothetical protein